MIIAESRPRLAYARWFSLSWSGAGRSGLGRFGSSVSHVNVGSTVTQWSSSLKFPQFDPSLGTLTAVTVSLAGSLTTDINITNNSEAASNGNVDTRVEVSSRTPPTTT